MTECAKCGDPTGHEGLDCRSSIYGVDREGRLAYVKFDSPRAAREALADPDFDFLARCKPIPVER